MFSEDKLPQAGKKTNKVLVKNVLTQTILMVLNKFSIKIFIKRKTRVGKACAYRCLSLKKSLTYKKN